MLQRLAILLLLISLTTPAIWMEGAEPGDPRKLAITDVDKVDDDFTFQGEYQGEVFTGQETCVPIGLQVVALGDGSFHVVEFAGGLPGAGALGKYRFKMEGERKGDRVVFVSKPLQITIQDEVATFYLESTGMQIARLHKVYRVSPTLGVSPEVGATVLFDGSNTDHLKNARITEDGLLMVGTETKKAYRDFRMHIEFRLPYMPFARGQGRANSGIYLQSRYEVQVLDSFGLEGKHNECGGLYKQREPDINMCFPPLRWQTYDIEFLAARYDSEDNKLSNVKLTVWHNCVLIHDNVDVPKKTGSGKKETAVSLPTKFQDHRNPVVFRNIWIVERGQASTAASRSLKPGTEPLDWLASLVVATQ